MRRGLSSSYRVEGYRRVFRKIWLGFIIIVAFFFILFAKPDAYLVEKISQFAIDVFTPVVDFVSKPFRYVENLIKNAKEMTKAFEENKKLKSEVKELRSELSQLLYLKEVNKELKEIVNYKETFDHDFVTARVMADNGSPFYDSFLIDAGKEENIKIYMPVLSDGGLIGRVVFITNSYARVLQITDMNSKIPVMVERTRTRGILEGNRSPYPNLINLENKTPVKAGDRIVTSGIDGYFPDGLPIGIIADIDEENNILVQPFSSFSRTEFVKVILYNEKEKINQIPANSNVIDIND